LSQIHLRVAVDRTGATSLADFRPVYVKLEPGLPPDNPQNRHTTQRIQ
jgi:hypothetical protein